MKKKSRQSPVPRRYRITVAYDGTAYAGFQYQENGPSVQAELEKAASYLNRSPVRVNGSGRTDAGVHARGQVAHFDFMKPIPPAGLVRAMNSRLPEDIRVIHAAYARPDFDARRSAHGKEYRYFLYNAPILPPTLRPFWAFSFRVLDVPAMRDAAARFVGQHDFAAFSANPHREIDTTVRHISSFTVKKSGPRIVFSVQGDGFLYKQVRSMVGFLIRVGEGAEKPAAVTELLDAATPRTARVPTAAARGLFLWRVWYSGSASRPAQSKGKV